jgi:hypothetical protein
VFTANMSLSHRPDSPYHYEIVDTPLLGPSSINSKRKELFNQRKGRTLRFIKNLLAFTLYSRDYLSRAYFKTAGLFIDLSRNPFRSTCAK